MKKGGVRAIVTDPAATARGVLKTVGGGVALVGLVELALLWFPPSFGVPEWEFGTMNETSRVVPVAGIGLALWVYGIARNPDVRVGVVRAASGAFILLAVLFAAGGAMYARAVSVVLATASAYTLGPIYRSTIQTGASVGLSAVSCLLIGVLLWRGIGAK